MSLRHYLIEMLEPTIFFCGFSALAGVIAAWHYGSLNAGMGILSIVGVMLAQMAVNLIDDYEDYASGLDSETVKTKFSGGSALISKKLIKPGYVLAIGLAVFAIAALIGLYIIHRYIVLLPFVLIGGITVLLYARVLSKIPFLAEPLTSLNFFLVSLGAFIAAGGSVTSAMPFLFAAFSIGMQVGIAVIVNYLPDREPDRKYGRRNLVVMINSNAGTAKLYLSFETLSFLSIALGIALGALPLTCIIVFATLPLVAQVSKGITDYRSPKSYEKTMAKSALAEFAFIILLALAFA